MKVSIIVPVYNEEKTIISVLDVLSRVRLGLKKEIIIVDDGSKDNSRKIVEDWIKEEKRSSDFKLISKVNGGKGSAVKEGIKIATGDIITIQDADLEYDPREFKKLIAPIVSGEESVVYGSRFLNKHKPLYKIYFLGNKFITLLTKILYGSRITDMETCYKVFRSDFIKKLRIKSNHFDIEPEITAKTLKLGIRIKEIPISYNPRTIEEGKKINWKDGVQAIYTLFYWKIARSD